MGKTPHVGTLPGLRDMREKGGSWRVFDLEITIASG